VFPLYVPIRIISFDFQVPIPVKGYIDAGKYPVEHKFRFIMPGITDPPKNRDAVSKVPGLFPVRMRNKRSEHREEDKKGDEQRPFIYSPYSSHKALLRKNFRDGKLVYVFYYTFLSFGKVKKKSTFISFAGFGIKRDKFGWP